MYRSIKTFYNYTPAATDDEIHAAALQFVRKVSGYRAPSKVNEAAFNSAVVEISHSVKHLLGNLQTNTPPRSRV
jgi:hypothetical protein